MKIYIDDSGTFNWNPPGMSLFCGISIPDKALPEAFLRFFRWKQTEAKRRKGTEVKGKDLTDELKISFVRKIFERSQPAFLTVVGGDTCRMQAATVDLQKRQSVETLEETAKQASQQQKPILARQYKDMAGWLRGRSVENYVWLACLENAVYTALQHTIARFLEPEFDSEFNNLEIVIDRSFIRTRDALVHWKELLRNRLLKLSSERPMMIPSDWKTREHPFILKYRQRPGIANYTELFREHLYFADSRTHEGLQIADILANICYRHHKTKKQYRPYDLIRPYIVGSKGAEIRTVLITEQCLRKDGPEQHVHFYDDFWNPSRQT